MRNAPKRPIKSRVRPRLEWLEAVTRLPAQVTLLPLCRLLRSSAYVMQPLGTRGAARRGQEWKRSGLRRRRPAVGLEPESAGRAPDGLVTD
jgi:hypothetical protein